MSVYIIEDRQVRGQSGILYAEGTGIGEGRGKRGMGRIMR